MIYVSAESDSEAQDFFVVHQDECNLQQPEDEATDQTAEFAVNAGKPDKKGCKPFTCSCKLHKKGPCSEIFTQGDLKDLRACHQALARDELDLVMLAQIRAGMHCGQMTARPKQKEQTERKRVRVDYFHKGHKICRDTFMFIHGVFKDRLTNLIAHYQEHGVMVRVHGNTNRLPKHALPFVQKMDIVKFISNYAEDHAILLPGRIPGYSRDDLKLLPSSCTKASVYEEYVRSCTAANKTAVAQRTFLQLWKECVPEILPMKPSTDLCWTCQRNSAMISSKINIPEEEKLELITKAKDHVERAMEERAEYKRIQQKAKVYYL